MSTSLAVERLKLESEIGLMPIETLRLYDRRLSWVDTARPDQLPPQQDYVGWMLMGGRGAGKTRAGAEETWWRPALRNERVAVIAPTFGDVRKTCFEGESGLLACIPKGLIANYNRTSCELWLTNGSYFVGYSSEEPERLRGPQHHRAWCDELAAWRYPQETWDMLMFGLRLGRSPSFVVTTTPRPIALVREMLADADIRLSTASTFDNAAHLPEKTLARFRAKYDGTRLGQQELYAKVLDDNPYALWSDEMIDRARVLHSQVPEMNRIVVAVDPPVTSGEDADECGIVAAGRTSRSGEGYVLADASCQGETPLGWAKIAVDLYHKIGADAIVAEVNQGGDMVEAMIRQVDLNVPVIKVHATRGKVVRAEPVSMMYEQRSTTDDQRVGRIHHVGFFKDLEDQMTDFTSDFDKTAMGYSPDRVDALVWAITELFLGDAEPGQGFMDLIKQQATAAMKKRPDSVLLRVPDGLSTVFLLDGSRRSVIGGQTIEVTADDAQSLRAAGFTDN